MSNFRESALQLVLKARDTLSRPVQQSASSLQSLRNEARELKQKLSALEKQDRLLSSFQKQTSVVRDAGKAYREAEAKVGRLAREYQQADKPTKTLQRTLESARKSVIASSQSYQNQRKKLSELRSTLDQAGLSNRNLSAQQRRLQKELRETSTAFKQVDGKAKQASKTLRRNSLNRVARDADRASGSIGRLSQRFGALVAASLGLYTVKRALQGLLGTGDQFERLRVQLNAVMGSVEEGERAIQWIKQFTRETPYQLEQVADAFVRLKAFGLDPMDGSMQAMVDQASKLGGGMERLNGISLAVGQAWAKQKLQGEEILQLVERGVPVWELLEKATGKNVQELQKLSSAGKLGRDTIALLIDEIGKSSAGAAAENMSLLSGYVSNLKDNWQNFLDEVAQSGALQYAKDQLKGISDQIGKMSEDGRLSRLARSISDGFISMAESIKASFHDVSFASFVASIQSGFASISSVLGSLRSAFVITGSTITLFLNGFTLAIKSMALVVTANLTRAARAATSFFDAIGADELAKKADNVTKLMRGMSEGFAEGIKQDQQAINDAFKKLGAELVRENASTQQQIRTENKKTTDEARKDQVSLNSAIIETADTAQKSFTDVADALKQIKAAETRTELADLGVVLARSFREGKLTQEQFNEALEANRQKLQELKNEAVSAADAAGKLGNAAEEAGDKQQAGAEAAASITGDMASYYNSLTSELHSMSSAAEDAFLSLQGVNTADTSQTAGDIADLKNQLQEAEEEATRLGQTINYDPTGLSDWFTETGANAAYVKSQFLEQKIALEELLQGYEDGSLSAESFASLGRQAAKQMNLLNQQDLNQLNRAIEQAESGMDRLADSTQNTLDGLQNELDRLQGKNDAIEQRQYESRQRDLKAQLNEARATGDSDAVGNLQKALSLNKQIYQEKRKQLKDQQREEQQREREDQLRAQQKKKQENPRITRQTSASQSRTPEKVIRLEYPGGSVNVGVARNDEAKLLEALKNAGMRSV